MFEFPLDDIYQMIYSFHEEFALWILIFGVIFGFVLSFVVGANDSANSWGTPVGAGTVSFGVAVLCGSVMELLGAVLLSAGVVRTIAGADSVVNISLYRSDNATEWGHFTVELETNVHMKARNHAEGPYLCFLPYDLCVGRWQPNFTSMYIYLPD